MYIKWSSLVWSHFLVDHSKPIQMVRILNGIWKLATFITDRLWTIWNFDMSIFQIPTVFKSQNNVKIHLKCSKSQQTSLNKKMFKSQKPVVWRHESKWAHNKQIPTVSKSQNNVKIHLKCSKSQQASLNKKNVQKSKTCCVTSWVKVSSQQTDPHCIQESKQC